MTLSALTKNREWNTRLVSTEQGEYTQEVVREFEQLWNSKSAHSYDDFIEQYTLKYNVVKKQREIAKKAEVTSLEAYRLTPNSMQLDFISNLKKLRESGEKRALLISATGDGGIIVSSQAKTA